MTDYLKKEKEYWDELDDMEKDSLRRWGDENMDVVNQAIIDSSFEIADDESERIEQLVNIYGIYYVRDKIAGRR